MFTGIIQEIGKIINLKQNNGNLDIQIECKKILKNKKIGDSISVNGACQTITKLGKNYFEVTAIPETIKLTNFKNFKTNDLVNLEGSLKVSDTLDGHFVLGHVDCSTTIIHPPLNERGAGGILTIQKPANLSKYIIHKGSITVNGVSLTISKVTDKAFEVSLIPHTLKNTNLQNLAKGDPVNIEIDTLARYILSQNK